MAVRREVVRGRDLGMRLEMMRVGGVGVRISGFGKFFSIYLE